MSAPMPYDEGAIVVLVAELYRILIRLGSVKSDEIIFAPQQGHDIDLSKLPEESRIDVRVLSILKRLPYPIPDDVAVAPAMSGLSYLTADSVLVNREIDKRTYWSTPNGIPDVNNALPTTFLLFDTLYRDGNQMILDVESNSIRIRDLNAEPDDYLACVPEPAPIVLRRMIDNYHTGKWLPNYLGDIDEQSRMIGPEFFELRRTLMEEYGWPNHFREQDWARERGAKWFEQLLNAREAAIAEGKQPTDPDFWAVGWSLLLARRLQHSTE